MENNLNEFSGTGEQLVYFPARNSRNLILSKQWNEPVLSFSSNSVVVVVVFCKYSSIIANYNAYRYF